MMKQLYKEKKTDLSLKLPQIKGKTHIHARTQRKNKGKSELAVQKNKYYLPTNNRYDVQKEILRKQQSSSKNQDYFQLKLERPKYLLAYSPPLTNVKRLAKPVKEDSMRESKLLLLKNMEQFKKRKNLGLMLDYKQEDYEKEPNIRNNYRKTTTKLGRAIKTKEASQTAVNCDYENIDLLNEIDFLKLFILEELVFYLSQTNNRSKEEMLGFCKIYLENTQKALYIAVIGIFKRKKEIEQTVVLQKLSLYIILLLSTDSFNDKNVDMQLKTLASCIHKNNLIVLDLLMQIGEFEDFNLISQFHIFNTMRFNDHRRKIVYQGDGVQLLNKNNKIISGLVKSITNQCNFESLKSFVDEILDAKGSFQEKYDQIIFVLMSLEQILQSTYKSEDTVQKPQPPFLPPTDRPYTLVLDLDETLIHYKQSETNHSFLVRPFCYQFLREMSKHYQIVIFTASVKQYADTILDIIDKEKFITHRLYRQHTRLEDYVSIKDLSMIGRDLSKCIIIDNIASNFKLQPRNGIYITTWTGNEQDCCLLNLIPILSVLVIRKCKDLRDGLEAISKYMEQAIEKNEQVDLDCINLD